MYQVELRLATLACRPGFNTGLFARVFLEAATAGEWPGRRDEGVNGTSAVARVVRLTGVHRGAPTLVAPATQRATEAFQKWEVAQHAAEAARVALYHDALYGTALVRDDIDFADLPPEIQLLPCYTMWNGDTVRIDTEGLLWLAGRHRDTTNSQRLVASQHDLAATPGLGAGLLRLLTLWAVEKRCVQALERSA